MDMADKIAVFGMIPALTVGLLVTSCVTKKEAAKPACVDFVREQVPELHAVGQIRAPVSLDGNGLLMIAVSPEFVKGFAYMPEHIERFSFQLRPEFKVTRRGKCWSNGLEYVTLQFEGENPFGDGI